MTFVLVSTVYAVAVGEPSFGDVSSSRLEQLARQSALTMGACPEC